MSLLKEKIEIGIEEAELSAQKSLNTLPPFFKWLFIVCTLALIPAYITAKKISTNFWLKNYAQTALTAHQSFLNPKPPITSDIIVTTQKEGYYAAVTEITNPNLELSLDKVPFEINFYNIKKELIYSYTDKLYLLPNQTKFLTVPTFPTKEAISFTNIHLPDELPWQKRLQVPDIKIVLSTPVASQQTTPPAFVITGDFLNQTPYTLKNVRLVFVIHDPAGKIIGTSQRDESTIAPFERRSYNQLWPNQYAPSLGKIEVKAYTDSLDPENFSVPAQTGGPASDLRR